jgi:uncharacterized membrane protein (DUF2068 family)
VSIQRPVSALDAMWRINPRALDGFLAMGPWAPVLLVAAAVACGAAGLGLWRFRRWGHRLAVAILAINAVGDTANAAFGGDRRAAIGIPIAIALVAYLLTAHVRSTFAVVPDRFRSPRHAVRGDS